MASLPEGGATIRYFAFAANRLVFGKLLMPNVLFQYRILRFRFQSGSLKSATLIAAAAAARLRLRRDDGSHSAGGAAGRHRHQKQPLPSSFSLPVRLVFLVHYQVRWSQPLVQPLA